MKINSLTLLAALLLNAPFLALSQESAPIKHDEAVPVQDRNAFDQPAPMLGVPAPPAAPAPPKPLPERPAALPVPDPPGVPPPQHRPVSATLLDLLAAADNPAAPDAEGPDSPEAGLSRGIMEEERNLDLAAALVAYQSVVSQYDALRPTAASAIFRLGECYRKMGRIPEAKVYYARILREFPEQRELADLSQQQLFSANPYGASNGYGAGYTSGYDGYGAGGASGYGAGKAPTTKRSELPGLAGGGLGGTSYAPPIKRTDTLPSRSLGTRIDRESNRLGNTQTRVGEARQHATRRDGSTGLLNEFPASNAAANARPDSGSNWAALTAEREALDQQQRLLKAEIDLVQAQVARLTEQFKRGAASQEGVDQAKRELLTLQRELAEKEKSLVIAKTEMDADATRIVSQKTSPPVTYSTHLNTVVVAESDPQMAHLRRQLANATGEAEVAEREVQLARRALAEARKNLDLAAGTPPEHMFGRALEDPTYQAARNDYADALLKHAADQTEERQKELDQKLAVLKTWVNGFYLPELREAAKRAERELQLAQTRAEEHAAKVERLQEVLAQRAPDNDRRSSAPEAPSEKAAIR